MGNKNGTCSGIESGILYEEDISSHLEEVKYLRSCYSGYDLEHRASLDVLEDIFTSSEGFSLEKGRIVKSRKRFLLLSKLRLKSLFFECVHITSTRWILNWEHN